MKLLILGGTIFLGRHIVEIALERGHEITLFTRGRHNPELFPGVERLQGDRDGGLAPLLGRTWDAVIDTSGYVPRIVRDSARLLSGAVGHYTFISTISVYGDLSAAEINEASPLATIDNPQQEEVTDEAYGPLKALCEKAAEEEMPGRTLIVRPGLIVGVHDLSDRFTYWPLRMHRGGEVLAPGPPERRVQIIDVRDLASWTLDMAEGGRTGVFNATGPETPLTFGELLRTCGEVAGRDSQVTWVNDSFLREHEVGPWIELPLWIPAIPEMRAFYEVRSDAAIEAGLRFRPLAETARETLGWALSLPPDRKVRAGLDPEKEHRILEAWRQDRTS